MTEKEPVKRQRSGIAFPYDDLETAAKIAQIAHERYAGRIGFDQLAADLNNTETSGGFRLKVGATRLFGMAETADRFLTLTSLGERVADPRTAQPAIVEAFLTAPLYTAAYERFKGRSLPGDQGLEAAFRDMGVPEKQLTTARQVFLRSAQFAGFFAHGRERLVMPSTVQTKADQPPPPPPPPDPDLSSELAGKPDMIVALFKQIPDEGQPFPNIERWKTVLNAALALLYPDTATDGVAD